MVNGTLNETKDELAKREFHLPDRVTLLVWYLIRDVDSTMMSAADVV